jgi:SAM-dependent methyltransferase
MTCSIIEAAVLRKIQALAFPKNTAILDAPCGAGVFASTIARMGFRISAADIDPSARHLLGDSFAEADLNGRLPWTNDSFDVVCSIEGIEHLENPYQYLRELHRVLRPSGTLILTTPNVISLRSRVRFFGSSFFHKDPLPLNEKTRHPLHHINLRPLHLLRYDLHTTGFQIEEVACTHVKSISLAYAVFVPWMWIYTKIALRKEKDVCQRERNKATRKFMFSSAVLFGENLLIVARKNFTASDLRQSPAVSDLHDLH